MNPITLIALWMGTASWQNSHPKHGEHLPAVDWLPKSAADISYFKSYSFTAYEFSISEDEFVKWADDFTQFEIREPFRITRYKWPFVDYDDYSSGKDGKRPSDYEKEIYATITNGLYASTPLRGNGGGTYWVYNRLLGRAYYQHSPR